MEEKAVQLNNGTWSHIPAGLSPEQEAQLIAELDPEALEAECRETLRLYNEGLMIPFDVLADLLNPPGTDGKQT